MSAGNRWRQHHRSDGSPKIVYATFREAKQWCHSEMEPYRCASCRQWHIGVDKSQVKATGLGGRVDQALKMENLQQPSQRRKYIVRVARKAEHIRNGTDNGQGKQWREGPLQPSLADAARQGHQARAVAVPQAPEAQEPFVRLGASVSLDRD